ncbi:SMR family transporter [Methylibium sp.]|uniref:SMR family transporter n=1 Tax=Methylibium sp. TaxID=2067992 RepID=UPI003D110AE0
MTTVSFALILIGVLLNAAAQLMLKAGTNVIGVIGAGQGAWISQIQNIVLQPFIVGGLTCYVFSVAIWIAALSRVPVSVAYPMLSIGYVVNAMAARYLFGESLSATKLGGIAVIIVGVWLVSKS